MIVAFIYIAFIFFSILGGVAIAREWPRHVVAVIGMFTGIFMTVAAVQFVLLHG